MNFRFDFIMSVPDTTGYPPDHINTGSIVKLLHMVCTWPIRLAKPTTRSLSSDASSSNKFAVTEVDAKELKTAANAAIKGTKVGADAHIDATEAAASKQVSSNSPKQSIQKFSDGIVTASSTRRLHP
jgi:hypothetical protein